MICRRHAEQLLQRLQLPLLQARVTHHRRAASAAMTRLNLQLTALRLDGGVALLLRIVLPRADAPQMTAIAHHLAGVRAMTHQKRLIARRHDGLAMTRPREIARRLAVAHDTTHLRETARHRVAPLGMTHQSQIDPRRAGRFAMTRLSPPRQALLQLRLHLAVLPPLLRSPVLFWLPSFRSATPLSSLVRALNWSVSVRAPPVTRR